MCGIAGYIGKKRVDETNVRNTLELMKNRGPDSRNFKSLESGSNQVVLLHSRLSIIDLDERSNQPFVKDGCTLIFNGEIYNYVELREELAKKGYQFHTLSDTEVLLNCYLEYGEDCLNHFEGMFSFAIYDERNHKFFMARDRFGEKPLYYFETPHGIFFASEVKFIKALSQEDITVNERHIIRYLINGYKSLYKDEDNYFNEIEDLSYASKMVINDNLELTVSQYWEPVISQKQMTMEEALEGFRHHLFESMKIRLRSDVPISFCLSGGIDSSVLASIAAKEFNAKIHTFSIIEDDERYDERDNIQATIDDIQCESTLIHLSNDGTIDRLKRLIHYHDAPLATITYYVHSFLMEAIHNVGYKVVFSGNAADELVTGYYDHYNMHLYETRNSPHFEKHLEHWHEHISPIVRNPHLKKPKLFFENADFRDYIYLNNDVFAEVLSTDFYETFKEREYTDSLLRNRMLNELFHESIRVVMHEDDLNAMMYSIENRSPYLDSKLFEFSYSIPTEYLIQNGYNKYILRESMKGTLNDQVRFDREKKGFNASIESIFSLDDKKNLEYLMEPSQIYDFVDRNKIEKIFATRPITNSYKKFMFNFINVKLFLEMFAQKNVPEQPLPV